jgi:uncharacterized membrane protein YfcA
MAILIGVLIGSVLGLTGAGGSIFAVPLLILLLGLPASEAMSVALAAVASSALLGAWRQRDAVLWWPSALISVGGVLVAPLGKYLAIRIDDLWLTSGFAMIALLIAYKMFREARLHPERSQALRAGKVEHSEQGGLACRLSPSGQFQLKPRCLSGLIAGGAAIGFASGLFGVGGGFLIIPLLMYLSAISMQKAVASSLACITLISGSGFASHMILQGFSSLDYLMPVLLASLLGMWFAQLFAERVAGPKLQVIFSALLVVVTMSLLAQQWF